MHSSKIFLTGTLIAIFGGFAFSAPDRLSSFKDLNFDEPISKGTEEEGEIYSQLSEDQCKEAGLYWQRDESDCCDFSKYFCGESRPKHNSKCDAVFCAQPSPKVGSTINDTMEEEDQVKPISKVTEEQGIYSEEECQEMGLYWQRDESDCCDFSKYFCGESRPKHNSKCDAVFCARLSPKVGSGIDKPMEEVMPKGGIFSQLSQDECKEAGLYWQRDESDCCDFSKYFCGESRPKPNSKCDAVRCAAPSFSSSIDDKTMVGEKKLMASDFKNQTSCQEANFHWYSPCCSFRSKCHSEPRPGWARVCSCAPIHDRFQ